MLSLVDPVKVLLVGTANGLDLERKACVAFLEIKLTVKATSRKFDRSFIFILYVVCCMLLVDTILIL